MEGELSLGGVPSEGSLRAMKEFIVGASGGFTQVLIGALWILVQMDVCRE